MIHLLVYTALAGLAAAIVSGVIGSFVVVKRIEFISDGIAHSVLGGMGASLWLQRTQGVGVATPILGSLISAITAGLIIGAVTLRYPKRQGAIIASLWSFGMATGVLFLHFTPGGNVDLTDFLVGNILFISNEDLWTLWLLAAFVLVSVLLLFQRLQLLCFDEDEAFLQGFAVPRLHIFLLILISLSVVLLIQVVGIILVVTLLIIPPTIARLFVNCLSKMMVLATLLGTLFIASGMGLAYTFDLPLGASIALLSSTSYLLTIAFSTASGRN